MPYGQKKTENILYLVLWTLLFTAPVLSMYLDGIYHHDRTYDWEGVWNAWQLLAIFFLTFVLHNYLLAPLLVYRNHKWKYALGTLALLMVFETYQNNTHPHPQPDGRPDREEGHRPEMHHQHDPHAPRQGGHRPPAPPQAFGGQDFVAFTIMVLLMGLNVGTKYFFKSSDDRKRMKELERENLHQQLEYLKYQINPHFFMNTLNNIHALVDINPEQAQYTIEVLSKLMRYVLYDSNRQMVALQKELAFIDNYVELMRIRYTDKVHIQVSLPSAVADMEVPPLLFITFVENAFKHGVSYTHDSFIEVTILADESSRRIHFICHNSRKPKTEDVHGGVGIQNAVKRLNLIYGDRYTLRTDATDRDYTVEMWLPANACFTDSE